MKKLLSILLVLISVASFGQSTYTRQTATSGTNTFTATVTSYTSYTGGIYLRFTNANTAASTLNINSLGAINLRKWDGDSWELLASGDIPDESDVLAMYDATNNYFKCYVLNEIGQGSGATGDITWEVQSGTTYTVDDTDNGKYILFTNASGCTITLPASVTIGKYFTAIRATGAGEIQFTDDGITSVLLNAGNDYTMQVDETWVSWAKYDATTWRGTGAFGDPITIYTAGNGMTLAADAFKWGGALTENTTLSGSGFNVTFGSSGTRLGNFRWWSNGTIGLDASTSSFLQTGSNTIATNTSGIDIATTGPISLNTDEGTAGQVLTSNGTGAAPTWEDQTGSVGAQDLFLSAVAMWPRVTGGCASLAQTEMTTSLFNVQSLDFDQTTQEFAQMQFVMPRNWNNGTITATVYWTAESGSGGVVWAISGGAYSNDDALTVALGTAQTTSDTFIAANDLHVTSATSAITFAGTPADSDFLAVQISRNPADGSDTLNADAKLLGVRITYTLDAGTAE
jgi:hypothetical protein